MGRGGGNGDNRDLETGVGLPCLTDRKRWSGTSREQLVGWGWGEETSVRIWVFFTLRDLGSP